MRIVQLGKYYPPHLGGIENNVWQCSHALAAEHDVTALVFNEEPRTVREQDGPVTVVRCRSYGKLSSQELCPGVARELARARPDVVHFHAPNPLAMTACRAVLPRVPLVITHHCDMVRQRALKHVFRPLYRSLLNRSAAVIVYTRRYAEDCEELRDYAGQPVIIPHGTDEPEYLRDPAFLAEAAEVRRRWAGEQPLAVFVGRLVGYKGLPVLVRAAARVPDLRVVIAGAGPEESALRALVDELGMAERVRLAGPVSGRAKWALLQAGDFLVLPSLNITESFGQVLVEAQLCGKPTLTTDIPGGVNEISVQGETGWRVPAGDVEALAAALRTLAEDADLRQRLGTAGRERAAARFTRTAVDERLRELFRDVARGALRPA